MSTFFCYLSFENGLLVTMDPRGDMYLPIQDGQKYLPVSLLFTCTLSFLSGRISIARLTLNRNGREVARLTGCFSVYSIFDLRMVVWFQWTRERTCTGWTAPPSPWWGRGPGPTTSTSPAQPPSYRALGQISLTFNFFPSSATILQSIRSDILDL